MGTVLAIARHMGIDESPDGLIIIKGRRHNEKEKGQKGSRETYQECY